MGLFGQSKSGSVLGVDIGTSGIKLVEVGLRKGRPALLTYGYTEKASNQRSVSPFEDTKRTGEILAKLVKDSGATSREVMSALPLTAVFSAIIAVPTNKKDKEFKTFVDSQVAKLTPIPLSDMITYTTMIDGEKDAKQTEDKKTKYGRVLVTGAARAQVQKYVEIFQTAKLDLKAVDTEGFALIRSLIGKDNKGTVLLLDIGSGRSTLTIVEKGIPMLTRSVNIGGDLVTKRVQEQLGVSEEEAERLKLDFASFSGDSSLPGGLPPILEGLMQPLVHEIRYAIQLYDNMELTDRFQIEKIVLTGGSSLLPRVPKYLAEVLNMNVYPGDPWERLAYPQEMRPVLDEIGPKMAVAIGLALRELDQS